MNRVFLKGNVGTVPELKSTQGGKSVAKFSLATSDRKANGEKGVTWHNIVVWDKLADLVAVHVFKGQALLVEGRIVNRSWETADGQKRSVTEIVADEVHWFTANGAGKKAEAAPERLAKDWEGTWEGNEFNIPF